MNVISAIMNLFGLNSAIEDLVDWVNQSLFGCFHNPLPNEMYSRNKLILEFLLLVILMFGPLLELLEK